MDVLIYISGILLLFLCIEILILILEVVKLSSSLQNYFLSQHKTQDQDYLEKKSLISLLSKAIGRSSGAAPESPDRTEVRQGSEKREEETPEPSLSSTQTVDGGGGKEVFEEESRPTSSPKDETTAKTEEETEAKSISASEPPAAESRTSQRISMRSRNEIEKKSSETETKAASVSVQKCPQCGRENSSFRKDCFFCNAPLTDNEET